MHRTRAILARGDPGFFDFVKKIGRGALSVAGTAFGATPIGAVAQRFLPQISGGGRGFTRPMPVRQLGPVGTAIATTAIPIVGSAIQTRMQAGSVAGGGQPAGMHLNKSSYFLRSGEFVPARSRWVRNRTRNNANGRALRRSIGRVKGFDNLVKRSRKALRSLSRI